MSIWSRVFIGKALRPFMKAIPGDVAHKHFRGWTYAYVAVSFLFFNFVLYFREMSKEGRPQKREESTTEYVHRVFKVQNPTVYKISWKGVEKEELDTSKLYTAPDDNREEEEDDDILK